MAALMLGACGGAAQRPAPHRAAATVPTVARRIHARPTTAFLALRELQASLQARLRLAGGGAGALVLDLATHRILFALRPDAARPPASVEKLYTSVALLKRLGPAATLPTRVLGTGTLGAGGTWRGDLYLRGGGDPTFGDQAFNRDWEEGFGPTATELSDQLAAKGIRRVRGRVIGDPSLFDARPGPPSSGYAADIPDLGGQLAGLTYDHGSTTGSLSPGAFAARELARTLRRAHIRALARSVTAVTPSDAQPLASVTSPPMSVLVKLMDVPSDDFFAEMLTKQLGVRFGGAGSTAAGAQVIRSVLAGYGLHPAIVDGSGLSRSDRSSPRQIVDLLRALWGTRVGHELAASLPVVGINGTVARIGLHTGARGRCRAKTGTLNDVTNLAGYCRAKDGHTLAFALFLDGPDNQRGISLLSAMVGAIARY